MSAKRYFTTIAIAAVAVIIFYPATILVGWLIQELLGMGSAFTLMIFSLLIVPFLPFVLAVIVGLASLRRLRETGGPRWWALAAAGVAIMALAGGDSIVSSVLVLPQALLRPSTLLGVVPGLAVPISLIAFVGLYSWPTTSEPLEKAAGIAAAAALIWLAPYALVKALPLFLTIAVLEAAGPVFDLYNWSAFVAQLVATIALLSLLFMQRNVSTTAAA